MGSIVVSIDMPTSPRPAPTQTRTGIALALSGGGYRAMLFHTGVLIRLNELGLLRQVSRVSSVSGGSIAAGRLGLVWKELRWTDGVAQNLNELYVEPILAFSRRTIDLICGTVGFLSQGYLVSPVVSWFYDRALFGGATLQDLPADDEGPRFIICASNLTTGSLWRFSRPYMADYRLGQIKNSTFSLARAVAASSAFPPILSPMRLNLTKYKLEEWPGDDDRTQVKPPVPASARSLAVLSDGGVYDNHGLEPVDEWPTLLVSDGGAPHAVGAGSYWNWVSQLKRVLDVEDNQVRSLRRRQLMRRFQNHRAFSDLGMGPDKEIVRGNSCEGTYWSIGTNPVPYRDVGGLDCPPEAVTGLATVATRLCDPGDGTRSALVNWGYAICDKSVRRWYRNDLPAASTWPMPGGLAGAPRPRS